MREIRQFATAQQAVEACGTQILAWLSAAMAANANGLASVAVSGGSSPKAMFENFAKTQFPWERVHLFWVDERGVPPTDDQSNFKMTKEAWLASTTQIPPANIHRIEAELPPEEAAQKYSDDIRRHFSLASGQLPVFDVIHRGMGPDAHTASLFPGEPAITGAPGIAAALWVEKFKQWRISLLPAVLESARHTAMLVAGADKTQALERVWNAPYQPLQYPAQIATKDGAPAVWFVDDAAVAALPR